MAAGINPMLAMALMGGQGTAGNAMNPMMMDPSFLQYQNQMQYGQNLLQEGSDASPAYPMQALARALAGITGAYTMNRAVGKLGQGAGGPPNPANEKAMIDVLGGEGSPLGRLWINGNRLQRYYIESSLPAISSSQAGPLTTKPGETTTVGVPAPVVTNAGPQDPLMKLIQDRNNAAAGGNATPDQLAALDASINLQATQAGYTIGHNQQGQLVMQPLQHGPADPHQAGALAGAVAGAQVAPHEAETAFKGAVDVGVANNSPQKTAPGEQVVVNPNRVPMPGASVPAVPAITMPSAQPVVPPSGVATPAVQPAMPAQPVAPPVVPQPVQQGAPAEVPQLRPDAPVVPGVTGAGPEGMQINPTLAAGATPLAPPPQGASPATPVPPPVVPAPTPAVPPPTPAEIKQSGGETITGNPYPPADILKSRYDSYNKLSDAAQGARDEAQKAQLLQQKLDQLGMGGPAIPFVANLTRFAQEAGVPADWLASHGLPNGATEEQANKLSIDLLGEVLKAQFPQRITNNDITLFRKTVAGPGLMPESSKYLIDNVIMPKVQRDIDRFGSVVDLPGKDRALDTLQRQLFDFDNKHPLSSYTPSLQPEKPPAGIPADAQKAPDGNWYSKNPSGTGYLKWMPKNG